MKNGREPKTQKPKRYRDPMTVSPKPGRRGNGNNRSLKRQVAKAREGEAQAHATT